MYLSAWLPAPDGKPRASGDDPVAGLSYREGPL